MKNIEKTNLDGSDQKENLEKYTQDFLSGNDDALRNIFKFIFSNDHKKLS